MANQSLWLVQFFVMSCAVSSVLIWLAARGHNLRKYGGRQQFYANLYRFTVMICTGLAMYLLGTTPSLWQLLPLPAGVVLFLTTALPTWVLCTISGRWYLGWIAAAVMQGFLVQAMVTVGTVHSSVESLWWLHVLCDLGGLFLYLLLKSRHPARRQMQA